jgi:N-acetylneuraminate synthase
LLEIGHDRPVHICAEAGQNHNGDLDVAFRLIDAAKEAGADSVKFQKRAVHMAVPEHMKDTPKETPWGTMSYLEYRERLEFSIEDYKAIDEYCKKVGIHWFVSVWDTPSYVAIKENFPDMPAWKIPSAMLTNTELLQNIVGSLERQGKDTPVILSTGMSTPEQIDHAVSIFNGCDLTILHCNSTYPCPKDDLNLRCITTLREMYPQHKVGWSGHDVGLATTVAAVALGALLVERHLTLDRSAWGTDQAASIEPHGFRRLVKDIRSVEAALGDGEKRITAAEQEVMQRLRG